MTLPAWIPPDVSDALKSAKERRVNGHLEIHIQDGEPVAVKETQVRKIRRHKDIPGGIRCPNQGCSGNRPQMESRDYGNLYMCPACGTKRTRTQLGISNGQPVEKMLTTHGSGRIQ